MRNRPVAASMRKSIVSSVVLAGLTSLALLGRVEPVSAKNMNACMVKHSFCLERCLMNSETEGKGTACIQRTCDHQYKACSGDSGGPDYSQFTKNDRPVIERPPRAPRPSRPSRGPRGSNPVVELTSQSPAGQVRGPGWGGILDNVVGFGQQGPAATGSPMAPRAPSAPPVIIR
jgi:hypothetical protein